MGSIICLFPAYSASQSFVLFCGIRVASMASVDSIAYSKRCSHMAMWMLILLVHQGCLFNPFQPVCFSSSGSDHFNIRRINSKFSQQHPFHLPKFSHPPNLFFKDSDFLTKYPFYSCETPSFFPINVLTR